MKAGYHGHCITAFAGWMLLSGFSSEWLQQFTSVCSTAWLQRTSLNCVRLSLRQQVVVVGFGRPQPAIWSYHAADCQPTAAVLSVSLVQSAGMVYRTIWNHHTFLLRGSTKGDNQFPLPFWCFRQQLKTFLFNTYWQLLALFWPIRDIVDALYKCIFDSIWFDPQRIY